MQKALWKRFFWGVFWLILSAFFFTAMLWWTDAELGGLVVLASVSLMVAIIVFVSLGYLLGTGRPSTFLLEGTYNLQWIKQIKAEVYFLATSISEPRTHFCIPTHMLFDKNEKPIKTIPADQPFQVFLGKIKKSGEEYKKKPKLRKVYFIVPVAKKKNK